VAQIQEALHIIIRIAEEQMREAIRYFFVALVWVVNGGVITVIYSSQFIFRMPTAALLLTTAMLLGASVAATWFMTRSTTIDY
jgi:hypothetical protein